MRLDPNGPAWLARSLADLDGWSIIDLEFWKPGVVRATVVRLASFHGEAHEQRLVYVDDADLARALELLEREKLGKS